MTDDEKLEELAMVCDAYGLPHSAVALENHLRDQASVAVSLLKTAAGVWKHRALQAENEGVHSD